MSEDKHRQEKAVAPMGVDDDGKLKQACDRKVAASRYVYNSAAAVITRKLDGGYVVQNPLTLIN